ncbi:lipopolysaccharide biosynthesis protein [Luteolibacter sp. GHJ8]|uniref:Lipopolysaccharide biosynthesis protein n=1 Tax=Luteolibacter rhizosphaerae TaxID=2989719 RepID=A0ABT3G295_9BACT|nr:lipopolysaccharide biosynthesis protein [Luteolibacter rhizosphaerae]MCW1913961.1 lipopolysaccharide biosynthesis protein [Luteolibacter rhizosphaerae]
METTTGMAEEAKAGHSARRDRSIKLAVATSFLSKAGTALFQLLSIPVAVRVLSREEFGLYTTVNMTLAMVALLQIGVGPSLAHGLSRAKAKDDSSGARDLASTAFFVMMGMALLAGLILASVLLIVPLPELFGSGFVGKESALRPALWTGLALFLLLFVLNLTERVREGLLESATNNVWGAVGNVLAAIAVGVGIFFVPEVWYLVLAVHGSVVIAKLCNTITLWKKHPDTRPEWTRFRMPVAKHLFTDGLAFSACTLVTGYVEYSFCGWLVGREAGPAATALYGIFVSMTIMQLGFVMMLSTPTWPAVAEALARGDTDWAKRAGKRLYLYGSGFALCSFGGLILLGPLVFSIWLGKDFADTPRTLFACYATYFVAHVWRHLNHAMMIGSGQVGRLARIQFVESALVTLAAIIGLHYGGMGAMLLSMGTVIFAVTGCILPRLVGHGLRMSAREHEPALGVVARS